MLRIALSRRWLGWHVLLLAGLSVMILLGYWQWTRAQSSAGTLQNLGYALEWWFFAVLAVYGWWRELRADAKAARAGAPGPDSALAGAAATAGLGRTPARHDPAAGYSGDVGQDNEVDEELAAYNAYLARLNARSERQRAAR